MFWQNTNVKKTVEWLLSKESFKETILIPNEKLIVYHYVDAFPWMQWSKFFKAISGKEYLTSTLRNCSPSLRSQHVCVKEADARFHVSGSCLGEVQVMLGICASFL